MSSKLTRFQTSARLSMLLSHQLNTLSTFLKTHLTSLPVEPIAFSMSTTQVVAAPGELPMPPFITVTGIPNFRDLGGYPISGSKSHSVRRGIVYRCGEPSAVTQEGIATIQQLGITHIYDLRSNNEIERNKAAGRGGVVEWDGTQRVFVPVFADLDYSPEKLAIRYNDYTSGTEVASD